MMMMMNEEKRKNCPWLPWIASELSHKVRAGRWRTRR